MKPTRLSLLCLIALPVGVILGRSTATTAPAGPPAGSAARPGGPGAPPKSQSGPSLLTQLQQTPGVRKKTALMLGHLANGRPGNMRQLVEAAGNDISQLLMLSDIALHTDPAGFLKGIIEKADSLNAWDTLCDDFIKKWAQTDFDAAFAMSRNLPYPLGSRMGGVVLEIRMATDPTATLKMAVAHPELRFNWNNDLKTPATPENIDLVRALPPSMGKFAMIKALSGDLSVDQALALVYEDRKANPDYGVFRLSEAIIEKNPQAAQEWVLANLDHPAYHRIARRFGDHLIKTNPAAAVEWATTHLSGSHRTRALEKAATELQNTDPAAADAARALLPAAFKTGGKP